MARQKRNVAGFGSLFEEDYLLRTLGRIAHDPDVALTELVANAWDTAQRAAAEAAERGSFGIFYRQSSGNRIDSHREHALQLRIPWTHASTLATQYRIGVELRLSARGGFACWHGL